MACSGILGLCTLPYCIMDLCKKIFARIRLYGCRLTDRVDRDKLKNEHHHFTRRMKRREEARANDISMGLVETQEPSRAVLNAISGSEAKKGGSRPVGPRRGKLASTCS